MHVNDSGVYAYATNNPYIYTYIHTYIQYIQMGAAVDLYIQNMYTRISADMYIHKNKYVCIRIYSGIDTCIHASIDHGYVSSEYTYIHAHIRT